MKLGESLRGDAVNKLIDGHNDAINAAAKLHGTDGDLIRAIIFEEQTHLLPGEALAESLGVGNTVGLGQITVGLHGRTRSQLLNSNTNIDTIGLHLSTLQQQPLINSSRPIQSLGTSYNCGSCSSISNYGERVGIYYNNFSGQ